MSGSARSVVGPTSRDMNGGALTSAANSSGPSVGVSSLVTDANSSMSGGPHLQQSTSINTDSYMRLPASPMSFSSNNISASSVIDASSMVLQSPSDEHIQKRSSSSVTSVSQHPSAIPDQIGMTQSQKKQRVENKQEDIMQQHMIQQLLNGRNSFHLQGQQSAQLQALFRQQKLTQYQQQQQQQMLQSIPQVPQQVIQQQQLRSQIMQNGLQPSSAVKTPVENGLCSRRLMQFLYHKRFRPEDNSITYWRKLVHEYFSPRARERWCVSSHDDRGSNPLAAFGRTSMDAWRCDICGAKAGKGFEATFEVLPRLCQIRFDHGVLDEHLFLGMPHEFRTITGLMVLEYTKVIQKSVYEHMHVVHEGQLRIIFTQELKILSWEFCSRHHEEFITRRLLTPQVNQLLQVAHNYQTALTKSGPSGVSNQDLQAICNMFVNGYRQLAKSMELHLLNEHGLSKRFVRCLQISEVVNTMKDLIDLSQKQKIGPIEGLKSYSKQTAAPGPHPQNIHENKLAVGCAGLQAEQNNPVNTGMAIQPQITCPKNSDLSGAPIFHNPVQNGTAVGNYQNMLRNTLGASNAPVSPQDVPSTIACSNLLQSALQQEASRAFGGSNQMLPQPAAFHDMVASFQPQPMLGRNYNQQLQQQVIQQLLRDAKTGGPNNSVTSGLTTAGGTAVKNGPISTNGNGPSNVINSESSVVPSRNSSFKSVSSNPTTVGNTMVIPKAEPNPDPVLPELEQILGEFSYEGLFGAESADGFAWNM